MIDNISWVVWHLTMPETVEINGDTYPVTAIADSGLRGIGNLLTVTIPSSVKSIGFQAFYNTKRLSGVTMEGNGPPMLDTYAFEYHTIRQVAGLKVENGPGPGRKSPSATQKMYMTQKKRTGSLENAYPGRENAYFAGENAYFKRENGHYNGENAYFMWENAYSRCTNAYFTGESPYLPVRRRASFVKMLTLLSWNALNPGKSPSNHSFAISRIDSNDFRTVYSPSPSISLVIIY